MELVGAHPTCLLKKTQISFEEAHHWNAQAEFYSVRIPTQLYACMIFSLEYKIYKRSTSVDLSKGIVVCPLLSFYFFFFFSIFCIFCGLNGSFYLSLICPLGIFCFILFEIFCPLWDLFLTLRETLYILQEVQKIFHTLQEVLNIKKI